MKKVSLIFIAILFASITYAQTEETIFFEDFESGWGSWWADNGVWDVGIPTVGPDAAYSPLNCAGTILDGDYPNDANTRLISPNINLPTLTGDEMIQLKYWQWFNIENSDDQGVLQISVNSGAWQTISSPEFDGESMVWTQYVTDLSAYAGSSVRIAFYFTSDWVSTYNGWYIDDVSIETDVVIFPNPEDFELGIGNWSADNGLWEVGIPSSGPANAHSGQNCAGTVLSGNYPNDANTRLISPEINLTPASGQTPMLFFYHWYIIENNDDKGFIQISVNGGEWETVSGQITGTNETWSQFGLNLSDYVYSTVRIAFYFISDWYSTYNGWYIDDIRIEGIIGVGINEHKIENPSIYPNPFSNKTTIEFSNPDHSKYKLSVFNITGNKVFEMDNITTDKIEFEKGNLVPGLYILEIKGEKVFRGKIVIK